MDSVRYREHRVPLEGIEESVEAVIELYGGEVREREGHGVAFTLLGHEREIPCRIEWAADPDGVAGEGVVTFEGGHELAPGKTQRILLLLVGSLAGILALMWPYFPQLGPILIVSAIIAVATFLLTLRMTPGGVGGDMLEKIARAQKDQEG